MPSLPESSTEAAYGSGRGADDDVLGEIDACIGDNRYEEACRLAHRSLARGVVHPKLFHLVAWGLEEAGRYDEALHALRRGLELAPADIDLVLATGFCLIQLQRMAEALAVFQRAVALDLADPMAHFGLGLAQKAASKLAEARASFERAVALAPTHARALAELAAVHEMEGRKDEAAACVSRALALDPDDIEAKCVSAKLAVTNRDFERAERLSRECIAFPGLGPGKRAEQHFVNADALDGLGRHRAAFEGYAAANALVRARNAAAFETPGGDTVVDGSRRVLDEFQAIAKEAWFPAEAGQPAAGAAPAFLFGFPRSGTTLLENVLASHPQIACLEEKPTLHGAGAVFLTRRGGVERLAQASNADLAAFRADYWRRMRQFGLSPDGRLIVDKQPLGVFLLPIAARLFPGAKVLFPLRDPRDVVLSCFRRDFAMSASMFEFTNLERTARYYDLAMRSWEAFRAVLPIETHEIRLEDLIADFDTEVQRVCRFLGLDWTEAMRDFDQTARRRGVSSRSVNQVTEKLHARGVAHWRRYEAELAPVLPILEPWVERFGYDA